MIASQSILDHLETLVAFDTRNGSGDEVVCVRYLAETLKGFAPDDVQMGEVARSRGKPPSAYVFARWGQPEIVINVHIDTVPSGEGWTGDPLNLRREGARVIGLGTSDIKGAVACVLAALETCQPRNVAVLFTGDEEHGSEVMPAVIKTGLLDGIGQAIVCEPTSCRVGRAHRGMLAFRADFSGPGGHSSLADITARPLLEAARLATKIGEYADKNQQFGTAPFQGLCVNIGDMNSDGAYNVIPTTASLFWSLRPPPGDDQTARVADMQALSGAADKFEAIASFESFATQDMSAFTPFFGETEIVDMPYWTEAAMLNQAGLNVVVFGPGNLEQAHKPNEYVEINQLDIAAGRYASLLSGGLS